MKAIILYSKPGCGACLFTKKLLDKLGLAYIEKNLANDPSYKDEVRDLGFDSLPVVKIGQEEAFCGYQPQKIEALLAFACD